MPYTNKAIALVWLVIYGLVALSGTGAVTGSWVLLLVVAAFVLPALILTPWANLRSAVGATRTPADRPLGVSDVRDHSRVVPAGDVHGITS
jgi:uncharacterized protein (DUF58 family)